MGKSRVAAEADWIDPSQFCAYNQTFTISATASSTACTGAGPAGSAAALELAKAAKAAGFELMVGCMGGSSLSMAPAMVLAQQCAFVDLDGPLLQSEDWPDGLSYRDGVVQPPDPAFWG